MARGFGATLGAGTTDKIVSALATSSPGQRSWHARLSRHGLGGSNAGRVWTRGTGAVSDQGPDLLLFANPNFTFDYFFSTSGGAWSVALLPFADQWYDFLLTYDNTNVANDPVVYYDGVSQTVTRTTAPVGTPNAGADPYILGNRGDNVRNFDGMMAEWAVWDAILDAAEAAALGKGVSPLLIRPQSLVEHIPMVRDNVSLKLAAPAITATAVQPHPRIFMPHRHFLPFRPAAGTPQLSVTEQLLPKSTAGIVVHIVGVSTDWVNTQPVLTLSGGIGGKVTNQTIVDATHITLTLTTGTVAGVLTVTDPSTGASGTTHTAAIAFLAALKGYWSLEETGATTARVDSSGQGNNLTALNLDAGAVAGKVGNAAGLTIASSPRLNRASNASLAIAANPFMCWGWAKHTDTVEIHSIFGKLQSSQPQSCEWWVSHGGSGISQLNVLQFLVGNGLAGGSGGVSTSVTVTDTNIGAGNAYFWCAWLDGSAVMRLQVNAGAPSASAAGTPTYTGAEEITIGSVTGSHDWMDGWIDEVGLAAKAPSANEITWLYNGGTGRSAAEVLAAGQDTSGGGGGGTAIDLLLVL